MSEEIYDQLNQIFNCFHDGYFESEIKCDNNDILLKINIQYLAKLIKSNYQHFYIKLLNFRKIELVIYKESTRERINNPEDIFKLRPDIFSADFNDIQVIIKSNINNYINNKSFYAELNISCENYKLYDQKLNEIDYRNVIELSEYYWKNKQYKKSLIIKSSKKIIDIAFKYFKKDKKNIYIGNSYKRDIIGSKNAGINSILINNGKDFEITGEINPDHIINDLEELL